MRKVCFCAKANKDMWGEEGIRRKIYSNTPCLNTLEKNFKVNNSILYERLIKQHTAPKGPRLKKLSWANNFYFSPAENESKFAMTAHSSKHCKI